MKMYVVLRPYSNTNRTSRYRVVDADAWQKFVSGSASSYPVESDHGEMGEAREAAAKLNDAAAEAEA